MANTIARCFTRPRIVISGSRRQSLLVIARRPTRCRSRRPDTLFTSVHGGMRLSVVTTLYKSERHVEEFHGRMTDAASALTDDFEIVMVDDGSPDRSLEAALGLARTDRRTRIVELSRNFGHHKAMMTGLAHARGDLVFLI